MNKTAHRQPLSALRGENTLLPSLFGGGVGVGA